MADGLFDVDREPGAGWPAEPRRRLAWLTGSDPSMRGPLHAARDVTDRGDAARPRLRVGWRVRRWLPDGGAELRIAPGRRAALAVAVLMLLGAAVAGIGVWRARPVPEPVPAALPAAISSANGPTGVPGGELVVSVAGLVVRPGLVKLPPGARVADAVTAAGGPVPGTDLTAVNLARRLTDGEHVVVGPAPAALVVTGPAGTPVAAGGSRVDLNAATLADLDALPGVGPVTAQRILDWRAAHGRFASVDQLREIDGIGETRFNRLRELVTV